MARICIIEDNAANLGLMSYLLTAFGHTVEGCRDGQSGLDAVRRQPPDLVLCDIQLPRVSGYEIARILRADPALARLPLVAVTALAMRGDREQALAAGFGGYIEKPIQPEAFAAQVEAFLPEALRRGPPAEVAHPPASSAPETATPHTHTVLAVDDAPTNLSLLQVILGGSGFRVLVAGNMQRGLQLMRSEAVDLVISDVHMLTGDGFTFRRAATAEPALAGVPFIFLSSTVVRDEDRREAERLGVCRLLERPLEPGELIRAVRDCLERHARSR